jgi:hypothetical protein
MNVSLSIPTNVVRAAQLDLSRLFALNKEKE